MVLPIEICSALEHEPNAFAVDSTSRVVRQCCPDYEKTSMIDSAVMMKIVPVPVVVAAVNHYETAAQTFALHGDEALCDTSVSVDADCLPVAAKGLKKATVHC